jgi:hypothetical protein
MALSRQVSLPLCRCWMVCPARPWTFSWARTIFRSRALSLLGACDSAPTFAASRSPWFSTWPLALWRCGVCCADTRAPSAVTDPEPWLPAAPPSPPVRVKRLIVVVVVWYRCILTVRFEGRGLLGGGGHRSRKDSATVQVFTENWTRRMALVVVRVMRTTTGSWWCGATAGGAAGRGPTDRAEVVSCGALCHTISGIFV